MEKEANQKHQKYKREVAEETTNEVANNIDAGESVQAVESAGDKVNEKDQKCKSEIKAHHHVNAAEVVEETGKLTEPGESAVSSAVEAPIKKSKNIKKAKEGKKWKSKEEKKLSKKDTPIEKSESVAKKEEITDTKIEEVVVQES